MARQGFTAQRFGLPVHYHVTCTDGEYYDNAAAHCYTKIEAAKTYANVAANKAIAAGEHVATTGMKYFLDRFGGLDSSVTVYTYRGGKAEISITVVSTPACKGHLHTRGNTCTVYACTGYQDW